MSTGASKKLVLKVKLASQPLDVGSKPKPVRNAIKIHNQTVDAANSFHSLFAERHKAGRDANDHYEQDLLRAMLLFACSGLDASIKQLIRDSMESVVTKDPGAQDQFAKFIERRLRRNSADDVERGIVTQQSLDYSLLAGALASQEPRKLLIEALTRSLTDNSLQSRDQILKVGAHFALTKDDLLVEDAVTKAAFEARNQLAHEMDIDFKAGSRRHRGYDNMVAWSDNVLNVGSTFIEAVSKKFTM